MSNSPIDFLHDLFMKKYSRLILLAGPPRSGTTWLNREICNATNMFTFLPECTLLTQQVELYSRTLNHCDPQRFQAYFGDKQNLLTYYRKNVAKMLDLIATLHRRPKANTLVLKDPNLTLYLAEVKELFPPHKLIVLVRDPRDVLASMKNVSVRKQTKWDVQEAATQLFSYYHQIANFQQQGNEDCLFARYEDLVAGETVALEEFLQQPILQDAFRDDDIANVRDQLDAADPFFSELYLQPTTQKKVGSYQNILTGDEIHHVETVYSGVIKHWRY